MFEEMLEVLVPTIPGITLEQAHTLARWYPLYVGEYDEIEDRYIDGNVMEIAIPWNGWTYYYCHGAEFRSADGTIEPMISRFPHSVTGRAIADSVHFEHYRNGEWK